MTIHLRDLDAYWGELTNVQRRFDEACESHPRVALRCGRQVGKTEYLARRVIKNLLQERACWWLAPTHQLTKIGFLRCVMLIRKLPPSLARCFKLKRSAPFRIEFAQGACDYLTTRTPESLQGATLDEVVIDEAASVRELEYLLMQYIEPTLAIKKGRLIMASTPRGLNDFYKLCQSPHIYEVHATTPESPLIPNEWLQAQYQRYRDEGRETLYRQEYLAEYIAESGHYFERLPQVVDKIPDEATTHYHVVGIDWGYSSPFAAVALSIVNGMIYVVREIYKARLEADEQARLILTLPAQRYVCDPSTPAHVLEAWRAAGLTPYPALNDRIGGWDLMRTLIRQNKLIIHRSCFHLLDEFQRAEINLRHPDDLEGDDHALDALRYALLHAERAATLQIRRANYEQALYERLAPDRILIDEMERARQAYIKRAKRSTRR